MRRVVFGWIAVMALISGSAANAGSELAGTTWQIEMVKGAVAVDSAKTGLEVHSDGRITTTVGCNKMSGMIKLDGAKLSFGPLASTRMACEPGLMDAEQKYGAALSATRTYRVEANVLVLMDAAGVELVRLIRRP
jgi:putative lipoprotein